MTVAVATVGNTLGVNRNHSTSSGQVFGQMRRSTFPAFAGTVSDVLNQSDPAFAAGHQDNAGRPVDRVALVHPVEQAAEELGELQRVGRGAAQFCLPPLRVLQDGGPGDGILPGKRLPDIHFSRYVDRFDRGRCVSPAVWIHPLLDESKVGKEFFVFPFILHQIGNQVALDDISGAAQSLQALLRQFDALLFNL